MSKVLISSDLIQSEIHNLEKEMTRYQGSYLALKIIKEKIDTLQWVLENGKSGLESLTWNELRLRHMSNSDESMGNWMRRADPKGLIIKGTE